MRKNTKYFRLKILLSLLLLSVAIVSYFYLLVPFKVVNHRAENQQYKALVVRGRTVVYIPYQIEISNNRLLFLKLERIDDESSFEDLSFYEKLIFSDKGIKIEERNSKEEKDSRTLFPFSAKIFYYFKRHMLDNSFPTDKIDRKSFEQLNTLKSEPMVTISKKIIDSLYQSDTGKRFNIHFGGAKLSSTKFTKLKINDTRQQQVILADTLKGMTKEATYRYLLKYGSTDYRDNLNDF